MHVLAPSDAKVPESQRVHAVAANPENWPAGQGVQRPPEIENVPAEQLKQLLVEVELWPAGQFVHAVLADGLKPYWPAGHGIIEEEPAGQ